MKYEDIIEAHRSSIYHRNQILDSEECGCFYCGAIFKPSDIYDWTDWEALEIGAEKVGRTALCPECGIDSVIGSASKYPITKEFLKAMNKHWF
ncbi:cytoplasmic protein [Vibrio sp.]|uniref:cytoplasmic protein n=1 Tax=Vibrio sp. TaxID=678 RepID=UPI0031202BE4